MHHNLARMKTYPSLSVVSLWQMPPRLTRCYSPATLPVRLLPSRTTSKGRSLLLLELRGLQHPFKKITNQLVNIWNMRIYNLHTWVPLVKGLLTVSQSNSGQSMQAYVIMYINIQALYIMSCDQGNQGKLIKPSYLVKKGTKDQTNKNI